MTDLYHASRTELEIGTVLESRLVRQEFKYQWDIIASALKEGGQTLKALLLTDYFHGRGQTVLHFTLKEHLLEHIRASEFAERPSRVNSVFLCPTKPDIVRFRQEVKASKDDRPHLYLCSIGVSAPVFQADTAFVRSTNVLAPIDDQLNYLVERARRYWQGDKSDDPIMEALAAPGTVTITATAAW